MQQKFLFWPIKNPVITQKFQENKACIPINGGKVITCDGNSPPPGYRSLYGSKGHKGIDILTYHGQPVMCAGAGIVEMIDTNPKSGLDVRVVTENPQGRFRHIYEHLLGYQPKVGDKIDVGNLIGWADETGFASGDHLHFELQKWVNGQWVSIDPLPYMGKLYALDAAPIIKKIKELLAQIADIIADKLR